MDKAWKIILLIVLVLPLAVGIFPFALMLNAFLGEISYNLLIYRHRLDWGAESLIGSAAVWAILLSLIFCTILIVRELRKSRSPALIKKQVQDKAEHKQKILELLDKQDKITNDEVQKLLGISDKTVERYLNELQKDGKIKRVGETGKWVFYTKT